MASDDDDSPKNGAHQEGRCISCGFLARDIKAVSTDAHREIDWFTRSSDLLPEGWRDEPALQEPIFDCFLHVIKIPQEVVDEMDQTKDGDFDAALYRVLREDRGCPEWFSYIPGFGPKAHFRRYEMQRLEQDRREFELKLAALTQKAEEDSKLILADSRELARDSKALVAEIKDIADEMSLSAKTNDRFTRRVTFWIILLAIAQIIVGMLALAPESWRAKLFQRSVPMSQPEQGEPDQR